MLAVSLADFCHKELKDWKSLLELFDTEMNGYQKRLTLIASQNTKPNILKQVEHFQNQFIVQKENFDILNHEIKLHEHELAKEMQSNNMLDNMEITDQQYFLRDKMHTAEKIFIALKHEFYNFAGRVL